jgi:hypothetical protein
MFDVGIIVEMISFVSLKGIATSVYTERCGRLLFTVDHHGRFLSYL